MTSYRLSGAVCAASLALTATAGAADLPPLDLPPLNSPPRVQELFSPWYVRIDGGYRSGKTSGGSASAIPITGTTIDDSPTIGGGFGAKWNWLRADLTLDYGGQTKFSSDTALGTPTVVQKVQNLTTLANAYLDLGTWWGFTPYVGAGAGYTYLKPSEFTFLGAVQPTTNNTWNFTWAATAGLSFTISPNFLVDVNYRYIDMGEVNTNSPTFGTVNTGDWTAQEFRIGLRYLIQ
jgi:opacity protein-like surface antigen